MPEVIGVYDNPPPAECGVIHSVRVAAIGAVPLLKWFTRSRDWLQDELAGLLE